MQVSKVNSIVPKTERKIQNKKNKDNKLSNSNTNNPASFKGGFTDTFCLGIANAIENGGLAVSFTLQDMLGTNLPRPLMGLFRNSKENKGEKNLRFAAKELVREMTTGPSMFIIPMIMLGAGKKLFGKTIDVPMKAIKSLGEVHAKNPVNSLGQAISKEEFYTNVFAEMIKNAKSEQSASSKTLETAKEFAGELVKSTDKKSLKNAISELGSKFTDITKSHASDPVHTDFTQAVIGNTKSSFKDAVSNMMSYADDVVVKASKNATAENVNKMVNHNVTRRFATNIIMYGAVMAFLQIIPKLYNKAEGDNNAGLKGLMKKETFNDETLNARENQKNGKDDKSKPSFGSSASFTQKLTGSGIIGKAAQGIEFEGPNVSFPLLLGIMGFGILLPRIINAKDKYDREEIIRRDATTCVTMCFAEKALRKGFSKLNEHNSGFVLADKGAGFKNQSLGKRLFDYLRPIKGVSVLNSKQIVAIYSDIDRYKDGVKGFCDFISGQGGSLSKVFSYTKESKSLVQEMLGKGKDISNATNEEITQAIVNAEGSETLKKLIELFRLKDKPAKSLLEKLFKLGGKTNPWIEKAQTLNARFTALSVLILVPAFLGFFLPWINEKTTKKRVSDEIASNVQNKILNGFKHQKPDIFKDITSFSAKS